MKKVHLLRTPKNGEIDPIMSLKRTFYLTDEMVETLDKVVAKHGYMTANHTPNYPKALAHVIGAYDPDRPHGERETAAELRQLRHLVEQMHVVLPQVVYASNFASSAEASRLNEDAFLKTKSKAIEMTREKCGQMQTQAYESIYVSYDTKQMKTIPLEKEKSQWK
jgi:hypothetical protein